MIGKGDRETIFWRGAGYGLTAGLGAIGLAKPLGLDEKPVAKTDETKLPDRCLVRAGRWQPPWLSET